MNSTEIKLNEVADIVGVYPSCEVCLETNMILSAGLPRQCAGHIPFATTPAAAMFRSTVERLVAQKRHIDSILFNLARFLTVFDTRHPCPRSIIELRFCPRDVPSFNERRVKKWIEQLRRDWLLPIGSHKSLGGGYYFITDPQDFIRWQRENLSSALTQIQTNYRVYKHNFREMAGQAPLGFE